MPSPVSKLSLFLSLPVCHRSSLLSEGGGPGGGRGGGGAKLYDGEKAWSSINHSIFSAFNTPPRATLPVSCPCSLAERLPPSEALAPLPCPPLPRSHSQQPLKTSSLLVSYEI
jgi:hypothetical protein